MHIWLQQISKKSPEMGCIADMGCHSRGIEPGLGSMDALWKADTVSGRKEDEASLSAIRRWRYRKLVK
jgi:hypothetical protein